MTGGDCSARRTTDPHIAMPRHALRAQSNGTERRIHHDDLLYSSRENIIETKPFDGNHQEKVSLFRRRRKAENKITVDLK
jgi:hypothetical protein